MSHLRIPYTAENFGVHKGHKLNGKNDLHCEWADIVWSAISVGKLGFSDLVAYQIYSYHDFLFRLHLIHANLQQLYNNQIYRSSFYNSLDSSEKSAISYFLGMTFAKLLASSLLDTPWLVHIEKLKATHNLNITGRSRPDLVGRNKKGNWIIVEAKGRTNGFSKGTLDSAKAQTRKLRHISGELPEMRVATETYFSGNLCVYLTDPDEYDMDAEDLFIEEQDYLMSYYGSFLNLVKNKEGKRIVINRIPYRFIYFETIDVSIGINEKIIHMQDSKFDPQIILHLAEEAIGEGERGYTVLDRDESVKAYSDGTAIILGRKWSEEYMRLDTNRRG